jgi:hypothetical protein
MLMMRDTEASWKAQFNRPTQNYAVTTYGPESLLRDHFYVQVVKKFFAL